MAAPAQPYLFAAPTTAPPAPGYIEALNRLLKTCLPEALQSCEFHLSNHSTTKSENQAFIGCAAAGDLVQTEYFLAIDGGRGDEEGHLGALMFGWIVMSVKETLKL